MRLRLLYIQRKVYTPCRNRLTVHIQQVFFREGGKGGSLPPPPAVGPDKGCNFKL